MSIAPRPQLLTCPDSLGGDLATLGAHSQGRCPACSTACTSCRHSRHRPTARFALTYGEIDPRFGTWHDIERIAESHDVLWT